MKILSILSGAMPILFTIQAHNICDKNSDAVMKWVLYSYLNE